MALSVTILYDASEEQVKAEEEAEGKRSPPLVCEQVGEVLQTQGHSVIRLAADPDVLKLAVQLDQDQSDLIFNVCESHAGVSQQEQNVAALLELLGRRFTGTGALGLALAQDKALAKMILAFHGISTPRFTVMNAGQLEHGDDLQFPMFVKPSNEDASIGIDSRSVVRNVKELMERISFIETEFRSPALIEEFIDGREIYIGVLEGERLEALPLLEWDFSSVPEGTPRIASDEAKWNADSAAFKNAREIVPTDIPQPVVQAMQEAAVNAFRSLKLRDYGRIDMRLRRVDGGTLDGWDFHIIEANPNPHLDRESELPIAAAHAGLDYPALIQRIVENAMKRPKNR